MSRFIQLGNKISVFIDGDSSCDHKWEGSSVMYSESGKKITVYTYLQWSSYTDEYRQQVIRSYHESICDPIVEITSTCSKCNKEFSPFWDINEYL